MGVRGAALATVISQCCSCVWVISFLFGKRTTLRIRGKNMGLKAAYILPCLALGSAIFIMQGSESIISVCFNSSLLKYGGDIAVGAMTILTSVMQFAMLPLQGLGQGAQPIISYNYGAKNASRVRAAFKLLLKVSLLYSTIPEGFCIDFYDRCSLDCIYQGCAPLLPCSIIHVWYPDCLSDDIQCTGKCTGIHSCCDYA